MPSSALRRSTEASIRSGKPRWRPAWSWAREAVWQDLFALLDISSDRFTTPGPLLPWRVSVLLVGGLGILAGVAAGEFPWVAAVVAGVAALVLLLDRPWFAAATLFVAVAVYWTRAESEWIVSPTKTTAGLLVAVALVALIVRGRVPRLHWMHLVFVAFSLWCLVSALSDGYAFFAQPAAFTVIGWAFCVIALNQIFRGALGLMFMTALWVVAMTVGCVVVLIMSTTDDRSAVAPVAGDPIDFAILSLMGFFLGLGLVREKMLPWYARTFFGICTILCLTVTVAAMSRGVWLAVAVGLIVHFIVRPSERRAMLGTLASVGVVAVASSPWYAQGIALAWRQKSLVADNNVQTRLDAWIVALQQFVERPLTGTGLSTVAFPYFDAMSLAPGMLVMTYVHNTYIEVLYGTGLIGSVLFFTLIGYVLFTAYRAPRMITPGLPIGPATWLLPTALAVYVASFTVTQVMYASIWILLAMAIAVNPDYLADEARADPPTPTQRRDSTTSS